MFIRPRLKTILYAFTILLTLTIISGVIGISYSFYFFDKELSAKIESKKFILPTEYYAAPLTFYPHSVVDISDLEKKFISQGYRQREYDQILLPGDYFKASGELCSSRLQINLPKEVNLCFGWVAIESNPKSAANSIQVLALQDGLIVDVFKGAPFVASSEAHTEPSLLAQYVGTEPLMQRNISLGETPTTCLNAIMAIEDASFLDHSGVSYKGIFRALLKNITSGRRAQGGSTITQQLVKNYFLTNERTIKRKAQEFIMSILLESQFTKDQILETYLNIIYMGQNGPFQVRGYGSASDFYFNKKISDLNLSECSLLAAIVNSPGLYNPFKRPLNAERRRNLVLNKMLEQNFVSANQFNEAKQTPLPKSPHTIASETAPYFLDAVRKQLATMSMNPEGLKIYTALDLESQSSAQKALQEHLELLEQSNNHIKKMKEQKNILEGAILLADNRTGLIRVAVGGRNYRLTQFNRAIDGSRQVGSIMKPFVYLSALLEGSTNRRVFTPITVIKDEKTTYKYEGQSWTPENYGKKFFGPVPLFYALKNSLNAATVALGMEVGLDKIVNLSHKLGITSELKPLPSMTLGSFEMRPTEVLKSYMTLANLGQLKQISFIRQINNSDGTRLYLHDAQPQETVDPIAISSLVGMMKQTVVSGTARSIFLQGFTRPAAGKTGTTSDNRDAWFAGFTPYLTAVVWVGYDNNLPHGLTGSSGAVPIWTNLMKKVALKFPPDDFQWPEQVNKIELNEEQLRALNALGDGDPKTVELIDRKN
jgi:penicillin-binding protein 1B